MVLCINIENNVKIIPSTPCFLGLGIPLQKSNNNNIFKYSDFPFNPLFTDTLSHLLTPLVIEVFHTYSLSRMCNTTLLVQVNHHHPVLLRQHRANKTTCHLYPLPTTLNPQYLYFFVTCCHHLH